MCLSACLQVELHVHGDGACRLSTLQELSRQHNLPYPHDDLEKFREVVSLTSPSPSLEEFLKVFGAIANILRYTAHLHLSALKDHCTHTSCRTPDALERIGYEFCEDSAKQNVVYAEYRFNPYPDVPGACEAGEYCEAVFAGLARGQADFNIKVRCLLCFKRENPGMVSPTAGLLNVKLVGLLERVEEIMDLAERYKDRGVVGVDIAGNELLPLDERHVAGFQRAKRLGLRVTVHAAESGPASNVKEAVEKMGAERIGHGYHVLDNKEIYEFAKQKRLHFEASRLYTDWHMIYSLYVTLLGLSNFQCLHQLQQI